MRNTPFVRLAALGVIAALCAAIVPSATAQAVKRGDPAKRLPKVGLYTFAPTENFPCEVGQKIFTDADHTIESVAPEMVGLSAARFAKGTRPMIGTSANVQLLIGYFKGEGDQWAKPPASQKPTIINAAKISGMPPVDVYLVPFGKNNVKVGSPMNITGTFAVLGVIPGEMKLTPWDAKGGEAK